MNKRLDVKCGVFVVCAWIGVVAQADVMGTNTWIGAAGGGSWNTASNWRSVKADGTENADASATFNKDSHYVYDFSSLADGAAVNNDCTAAIRIAGLVFGSDKGSITLNRGSQNFYFSLATKIEVGAGTTVDFKLKHTDKWGGDAGAIFDYMGGGVFVFDMTDLGLAGSAEFRLSGATTLRIPVSPASVNTGYYIIGLRFLDAASVLDVRADNVRFRTIESADGIGGKVELNGHKLEVVNSTETSLAEKRFSGYFNGPGTVCLQGGSVLRLTNDEICRNGATLQVKTSCVGEAGLGDTTTLEMADNGHLTVAANETVVRLSGEGTRGRVEIASGAELTVGAAGTTGDDTYSARVTGAGKLVKDGSGYTLTLDGENALTGGTEVKAGKLVIKSVEQDPVPQGLVAHWKFDDPNDLGKDSSGHDVALAGADYSATAAGVIGGAVHLTKGADKTGGYLKTVDTLGAAGLPTGADAISFAYWVKVSEWPSGGDCQVSLYGQWTGGGRMYLMRAYSNGSLSFSSADAIRNMSVTGVFQTDRWVHVVGTYDGNHNRVVYVNGVQEAAAADKDGTTMAIASTDYFTIGTTGGRSFTGDVDDYRLYNRALTAAEVKRLYDAGIGAYAAPETVNAAALLPNPVAQYTFDDVANFGADTSGNGYDLTVEGTVTPVASRLGAYGGCVKLAGSGYLKASSVPELVPTSGSFSVSVRVQPGGTSSPSYVFWGADSTTAGSFFRAGANNNLLLEQVGSFSTSSDLIVSDFFSSSGGYSDTTGSEETWLHMVYTYDLSTKTMTAYRDGHFVKSNVFNTVFAATRDCFYIGYWPCGQNIKATGYFDDVRIYDCALTAEQVRALTRSLPTGSVPSVLSAQTSVSVAAGATLATIGIGNVVPRISGAGSVRIGELGSVTLADAAAFTGAVTGKGTLYLGGAFGGSIADFAGAIGLSSAFNVTTDNTQKNLPVISCADGAVTLPATGTLSFDCAPKSLRVRKFVIAEAQDFVEPANYSGWTLSPADAYYRAQFLVEEDGSGLKRFVAKMKYIRGFAITYR